MPDDSTPRLLKARTQNVFASIGETGSEQRNAHPASTTRSTKRTPNTLLPDEEHARTTFLKLAVKCSNSRGLIVQHMEHRIQLHNLEHVANSLSNVQQLHLAALVTNRSKSTY